MQSEPNWLDAETLVRFNQREVQETQEPHHLRDKAALETCAHNPINRWHYGGERDTVKLAVALLCSIAMNHPFEQGNKRTAFTAAIYFIETNGYRWVHPDDGAPDTWLRAFVEHKINEEELFDLISECVAS